MMTWRSLKHGLVYVKWEGILDVLVRTHEGSGELGWKLDEQHGDLCITQPFGLAVSLG
jgi:hypothetical protein